MKFIYTILFLSIFAFANGQVTLIPDQGFEQTLLDQNIDSDDTLNGQVLTSDISGLLSLSLNNYFIENLSGLEDFISLQIFNLENFFESNNDINLDLSQNTNLKKFTMYGGGDAINNSVERIILNNNPSIDTIHAPDNWLLRELDLKTGSTDVSNLDIDIHIIPFDLWGESNEEFNENLFCIKVTDEIAATAGTGVYSTWTIKADDNPYYFSETCALSTDRFNDKDVSIYPIPATEVLNIKTKNFQINSIKIHNLQGQLVRHIKDYSNTSIDISELAKAMYIIHLASANRVIKKKFLKQ